MTYLYIGLGLVIALVVLAVYCALCVSSKIDKRDGS